MVIAMTNPPAEGGYTRIADEILENMARVKLSPTQYRILFVVWRYTYGFNRKRHHLSLGFLEEATGCDRRSLQREVKRLLEGNILVEGETNKQARLLGFNERFSEWSIGDFTDDTPATVGEPTDGNSTNGSSATGGETATTTVGEITTSRGGETATQDIQKTNLYTDHHDDTDHTSELGEIHTTYFNTFGTMISNHNLNVINSYLNDGLTEWHICEALRRTAENNKRTFKYTMAILTNWLSEKAVTPEDVERLDKLRQPYRQRDQDRKFTREDFTFSEPPKPDPQLFPFLAAVTKEDDADAELHR
jgi:phage replication O-like protein O